MACLAPGVAALFTKIGEVHTAVAAASLEIVESLGGAVEIKHCLQPIARPFDRGDALRLRALVFSITFGKRRYVVNKHRVENAVFVFLLRAVARVKVASDAFVLEDNSPWDGGGVGGEKRAAWDEGKRLHISHDTLEVAAAAHLRQCTFLSKGAACRGMEARCGTRLNDT